MTLQKVVIDRRRWGRGLGIGELCDRNRQNCCCLSFVANQLNGTTWNEMRCCVMPDEVASIKRDKAGLVKGKKNSKFALGAAVINDAPLLAGREKLLITLFAENNIELTFTH